MIYTSDFDKNKLGNYPRKKQVTNMVKKGISVVQGVGKSGAGDVVTQIHSYDFENGGVTTKTTKIELYRYKGLLWWNMDQLQAIVEHVIKIAGADVPVSWLMPGANVATMADHQVVALDYRSFENQELFRRVKERVGAKRIWTAQGQAAAQWFQAIVHCLALAEAGFKPKGARMLCDEITTMLSGVEGRSASMARSNGLDGEGCAQLFNEFGLLEWHTALTAPRLFGLEELVTGRHGCVLLPDKRHDSLPTRRGGLVAKSIGNEFVNDALCQAVFNTGGWSMVFLLRALATEENLELLFQMNAAQEGLGMEAGWVRNSIKPGVYADICATMGWDYDMAAERAGMYLPWHGGDHPLQDGVIMIRGQVATAEEMIRNFGVAEAALAYLIWKSATVLVDDYLAMTAACGIQPAGNVALTGGFSNNPLWVALVEELLQAHDIGVKIPRFSAHMTEDAGIAAIRALMLGISFQQSLDEVHLCRDGQTAIAR